MSDELMKIYAECSEAIRLQQTSLEECVQKYPQFGAELSELLQLTQAIEPQTSVQPTAEFKQAARQQLLDKLPARTAAASIAAPPAEHSNWLISLWARLTHSNHLPERLFVTASLGAITLALLCFGSLWLGRTFIEADTQVANQSNSNQTEVSASEVPTREQTAATDEEVIESITGENTFAAYIPAIAFPIKLAASTAGVEVTQGVVEIMGSDGKWQTVSHLTVIKSGERIRTRTLSSANITFFDGSRLTLAANSELVLDEIDANRPETGLRTIVMTQLSGESKHHVDFRGDSGSRYEVLTPNGSGRARGTTFSVTVLQDGSSHFQVDEGRVQVANANVTRSVTDGQLSIVAPNTAPSQPYFVIFGQGEVTAQGDEWVIGGQTFATNAATIIVGNPQIGDVVSVLGYLGPDGSLVAIHILLLHDAPANQFSLTGIVESIEVTAWLVAGQTIVVDEDTAIAAGIEIGDRVHVEGIVQSDGTLLATEIRRADEGLPFEFVGLVETIGADIWTISNIQIIVDTDTVIDDGIEPGDVVRVSGHITSEGLWLASTIVLVDNGDTTFALTGIVDSIDPWVVAGIQLTVDDFSLIDDDIEPGDVVVATGRILADGTWLANEIRLLADDELNFSFIGIVSSQDPWVIGGIAISVDEDTEIDDDIEVGTLVRVSGIILDDGQLLATNIENLDDNGQSSGCFTITTIIVGISGNQLNVAGLPPLTLGDDHGLPTTLSTNTLITITVCVSADGTVTIITIIIIIVPPAPGSEPPPGNGGGDDDDDDDDGGKVTICHKDKNTLSVSQSAVSAHLGHGDYVGSCGDDDDDDD